MTLSMVVEHLSMVVFAIVIAILIGVPLGLLCYLSRAARGVVLRVVDLIQTTPALALLGISVGAVNTEPVQEFLYHISTAVQVGVFRQDITTEEGGGPHPSTHA